MTTTAPNRSVEAAGPLVNFGIHYTGLLRFLTRRTGCADTARDLVHDTWVRLAEREAAVAGSAPRDERAYLYTVAAHLASNWQRHARHGEQRFVAGVDADAHAAHGDVAHTHALRQAVAAVEQALLALPARCRSIFLDQRLDGTAHAELARTHGVSVKTVEREVMLAMDAVHTALLAWRGDARAAPVTLTSTPATVPTRGRRKALSALLSLTGLGSAGTWAWQAWRHSMAQFELALSTPKAKLLRQPLPDGSEITLDADSLGRVAFYGNRRHVSLARGSAFFAVVPDATRQFIVDTALARITVLGTRFEVETHTDSMRVAVESGRVQVQALRQAGGATEATVETLATGDTLHLSAAGLRQRSAGRGSAAGSAVAPWRDGWLDFQGLPLGEAALRLARYSPQSIRVADEVAGLRVLGRVRVADAAGWLRLLPKMLPVRVQPTEDGGLEIGPR